VIHLRKIKPTDFKFLCQLLTNPRVRKYLGGELTREQAKVKAMEYINSMQSDIQAVEYDGQLCGTVSLGSHAELGGTEVSYQLLPQWYGKGIAYRAVELALEKNKQPFVAETQDANLPSRRLLKKLGFTEIATLTRYGEKQVIATKTT
jgi:ribosomal-protein-alanine N-acetyltransferase